ncbi:MAG: hypothetical protein JOZ47_10955 [Kutzneria sp.]|nr:hypothetical protein [Kutzneria sp.]MBV9845579.1 hypothetical protein [Kutzneria sp.]
MELSEINRLARLLHPVHLVIYFAPEAEQQLTAAGLRPGRMGYFASRSAPMGAVGPSVVTATFYNFSPDLIARHIPRAWTLASPDDISAARLAAADAALRRLLGDEVIGSPELADAAELARVATEVCTAQGRALFAGHADLAWPLEPHLVLWHAATLLREYRGDGHIAALQHADLSGLQALIAHTATGQGFLPEVAKSFRGWSDEQWAAGQEYLRDRGLLDEAGALTPTGAAFRAEIEEHTDRLDRAPWTHLGADRCARLAGLIGPLVDRLRAAGAFPPGVFANSRLASRS